MADFEILAQGETDTSNPATVNITGIPGTFKHLMISIMAASTRSSGSYTDYLMLRFNSDTASNYGYAQQNKIDTDGTGTQSRSALGTQVACGYWPMPTSWGSQSTKSQAHCNLIIPLYASTTFVKSVLVDWVQPYVYNWPSNGANTAIGFHTGISGWNSTAAITSIQMTSYEAGASGNGGFRANTSYLVAGLA
jgi:hypothetical protein